MKKLFLPLLMASLFSCSKNGYKPDQDQLSCEKCISYKEKLYSLDSYPYEVDTAFSGYLCEQELIYFRNKITDTLIYYCGNPQDIHWEHIVNKIIK